ncbi:MAG: hypothetical protein IPM82_22200 [Saprospiraceae bacterium]|nr:hypothetical protein [Saprospiraceae bacterium]
MSAYKFLSKSGTTVAFLVVVVLFVIALIPIFAGLSAFNEVPTEKQAYAAEGSIFSLGLWISLGLLVLTIAVTLFLSLVQIFTNPGAAKKGLISFGIILVLFIVFYAMTDTNVGGSLGTTVETFKISDSIFSIISGGIQLSLLMLVGLVALAIIMEIWGYFKNQ